MGYYSPPPICLTFGSTVSPILASVIGVEKTRGRFAGGRDATGGVLSTSLYDLWSTLVFSLLV